MLKKKNFFFTNNNFNKKIKIFVYFLIINVIRIIYFPISLTIIIVIRLLSPIILIRTGQIPNSTVGDFIFDTQVYLQEKKLKKYKSLDLFFKRKKISPNTYYEKMLKKNLIIFSYASFIHEINIKLPFNEKYTVNIRQIGGSRDYKDVFEKSSVSFLFNQYENNIGLNYLKKIGLSKNDKFICIINRDSNYKKFFQSHQKKDWSYHDHRNSDINNYRLAAIELEKLGYWVFRMGIKMKGSFDCNSSKIIDYNKSKDRTDLLDLYLFSKCYFALGRDGGIICASYVSNVPCALVNVTNLVESPASNNKNLIIFKKFWHRKLSRYLTIKEIIINNLSNYYRKEDYDKNNLDLHENTDAEIKELAVEMHNRLNNIETYTSFENNLQKKFIYIFPKGKYFVKFRSRIGKKYLLRDHQLSEKYETYKKK